MPLPCAVSVRREKIGLSSDRRKRRDKKCTCNNCLNNVCAVELGCLEGGIVLPVVSFLYTAAGPLRAAAAAARDT